RNQTSGIKMNEKKFGIKNFRIIITFMIIWVIIGGLAAAVESNGLGWKFRSDLENSGLYDDGGVRPDDVLLWSHETFRSVDSSPTVANNLVYIGTDNFVKAFDPITGDRKWEYWTSSLVTSSAA